MNIALYLASLLLAVFNGIGYYFTKVDTGYVVANMYIVSTFILLAIGNKK